MNCSDYQQILEPYIRQELSPKKALVLEEHIQNCRSCKNELDNFTAILTTLSSLPKPKYEIPKNLVAKAIQSERPAPKPRRSHSRRPSRSRPTLPFIIIPIALVAALTLLWTLNKAPTQNKIKTQPKKFTPNKPLSAPPQIFAKKDDATTPDSQKATETPVPGTGENKPTVPLDIVAKTDENKGKSEFPGSSQVSPDPSQVSPDPSQVSPEPKKTGGSEQREEEVVARVVRGGDRIQGYLGSEVRSKQVIETQVGQSGVCLSMEGATVFLGGGSRATFSGGAIQLMEGELLVDQRDVELGKLVVGGEKWELKLGAGVRVLLSLKVKKRLTVLNGAVAVFGKTLNAGQQYDLKKNRILSGRAVKEPRWVRKLREKKTLLYDLKDDLSAKDWLWGGATKETVKARTLMRIGRKEGTASYNFGANRKAVPYLCRFYKGTYIEFDGVSERDCDVQLRVFDHSRQDNYDKVVSLKAGRRRQILLKLEDFVAVDQSGIKLGEGHVITGLSIIIRGAQIDPGLRIIDYRIFRIPK